MKNIKIILLIVFFGCLQKIKAQSTANKREVNSKASVKKDTSNLSTNFQSVKTIGAINSIKENASDTKTIVQPVSQKKPEAVYIIKPESGDTTGK